jgi:hypothetical protein
VTAVVSHDDEVLALQELPESGGAHAEPGLFGLTSWFSIDSDCIPLITVTTY